MYDLHQLFRCHSVQVNDERSRAAKSELHKLMERMQVDCEFFRSVLATDT